MRESVIFGISMLIVSGCSCLPPIRQGVATLEFERQEDNGSVNIVPCTLVLSDHQRATLVGGQHATVAVTPGNFWVEAFSPDSYSSHYNAETWRSARVRFRVESGERIRFSIAPKAEGSTYSGGWIIEYLSPTDSKLQRLEKTFDDAESQTDMNLASLKIAQYWDEKLASIEARVTQKLDAEEQKAFADSKARWRSYRKKEVQFRTDFFAGGSIQPLIANESYSEITGHRVAELESLWSDALAASESGN